jgi:hypothetical protein
METHSDETSKKDSAQAAAHITGAQEILKTLQDKLGQHPEIGAAITKLEMALNLLAVKTGGVL